MAVFRLSSDIIFPNPDFAEEDGLLAVGGDLSAERLVLAYCNGIFPWYNPGEEILWWCPKPRFIIYPHKIKVSKSMNKIIKWNEFNITFNKEFESVISHCKKIREDAEGTWITNEMKEAYIKLHDLGLAMSVEVYKNEELVGGLYGVKIGKCIFGESMFSKVSNASKAALIYLAERLKNEGFLFIDCQMHNNHLESMGGEFISWEVFKNMLKEGTVVDN